MPGTRVIRRWHDEAQARRYRDAGIWGDITMPEMFDEHVGKHPEKIAVIDGQVRWTYGELADLTRRAALDQPRREPHRRLHGRDAHPVAPR